MHTAIVFVLVQLLLAVTWTVYAAFLPQLAAQAGIPKEHVAWILLMDQAIFVVTDVALGVAADRAARAMRRLGGWLMGLTIVSCIALVLMARAGSPVILLALTAIWAATSSALRAPPLVMIAKRITISSSPFFVAASFLGVGIAGALAPMLTAQLRGTSPLLPFALASVGLAIAVLALAWTEKTLQPHADSDKAAAGTGAPVRTLWLFFGAVALLGLGFQVHTALNSAPAYVKFAGQSELEKLMPAFWIGFVLCALVPGSTIFKRFPQQLGLLAAATLGAIALWGFAAAASLPGVLAAQFTAGAFWGVIAGAAANSAIEVGRVGREGGFTGLLFGLSALATFARIALVASGINKMPIVAALLPWLPPMAWGLAALLLAAFVMQNFSHFTRQLHATRHAAGVGNS
ncbi:MAG: transporter [Herminiimonas sp.]|nr:transporter [Herminiimonas sp.]